VALCTLAKRPNFVRPTYWEQPMPQAPGLPPKELGAIHFHALGTALAVAEAPAAPTVSVQLPPSPEPPAAPTVIVSRPPRSSKRARPPQGPPPYAAPPPRPAPQRAVGTPIRTWVLLAAAVLIVLAIVIVVALV
jgi:hypothetical protein